MFYFKINIFNIFIYSFLKIKLQMNFKFLSLHLLKQEELIP